MNTLQDVFAELNDAGVFLGADVQSVHDAKVTGDTALHIVSLWGDVDAINVLVENGADLNKQGEDRLYPITLRCGAGAPRRSQMFSRPRREEPARSLG